jgi:N-acyl homoserine lactone hydrolase
MGNRGSMAMWAIHGPTMTVSAGLMLVGATEILTIPVPCYLIQHPHGLVLFDTGFAPQAHKDPVAVYGALAEHVQMNFPEEQLLENQLDAIGFRLSDVTHVVCSHAHLDHTGGLHLFPQAKFYAGAGELSYAFWPDTFHAGLFRRPDLEATRGFDWTHVHGDLDLFGDGTIVMLSMPGHTPGNMSMLVRLPRTTFLLSADTVHLRASLDGVVPMPNDYDNLAARRSVERLAQIRDSVGATLWIAHDPEDAAEFRFAPHSYE